MACRRILRQLPARVLPDRPALSCLQTRRRQGPEGNAHLYSYGLYSYGLYSYGLYSYDQNATPTSGYGRYSYGQQATSTSSYGLYSYGQKATPASTQASVHPWAHMFTMTSTYDGPSACTCQHLRLHSYGLYSHGLWGRGSSSRSVLSSTHIRNYGLYSYGL